MFVQPKATLIQQQLEERVRTHPHEHYYKNHVTTEAPWRKAFIVGHSTRGNYITQRAGQPWSWPREHP